MGARSCLLHRIEQAMKVRGHKVELRDIPELRAVFKGRSGPFDLAGLNSLLIGIIGDSPANLDLWMAKPPPKEKGPSTRRAYKTKCKLDRSEMLELRSKGVKAIEIARMANVRVARIYQILGRG